MLRIMKKWKLSSEIVALMEEKSKLEIDLKNLRQNLDHEQRRQEMAIDEERSKHRVEMQSKEKEYEIKQQEIITLLKLESEQKLKQAEINFERTKTDLLSSHKMEIAKLESKLAAEYYEKLSNALEEMNSKGNVTTKFMQELTMQMFAQAPKLRGTRTRVNVKAELPARKD